MTVSLDSRLENVDWADVESMLDERGYGVIPGLLAAGLCRDLRALWAEDRAFRKRIDMARHGYGRGAYGYFAYPLPPDVATMRAGLYTPLAAIANRWHQALGDPARFPVRHGDYTKACHLVGQSRPTPLLLRYGEGDFNRLHQDVYGERLFPLQVIVLLSEPGEDFTGGELAITEQRARMQSRVEIVPLRRGDAAVIAVRERPGAGKRGPVRLAMRHGVQPDPLGGALHARHHLP